MERGGTLRLVALLSWFGIWRTFAISHSMPSPCKGLGEIFQLSFFVAFSLLLQVPVDGRTPAL